MKNKEVTVYSCSGCSNVAQLANSVAVKLHRNGIARMSCIAGVGGDVSPLVKTAKAADKILVLDGCPLNCAAECLKKHDITPDAHYVLTKLGLTKNPTDEVPEATVEEVFEKMKIVVKEIQDGTEDS